MCGTTRLTMCDCQNIWREITDMQLHREVRDGMAGLSAMRQDWWHTTRPVLPSLTTSVHNTSQQHEQQSQSEQQQQLPSAPHHTPAPPPARPAPATCEPNACMPRHTRQIPQVHCRLDRRCHPPPPVTGIAICAHIFARISQYNHNSKTSSGHGDVRATHAPPPLAPRPPAPARIRMSQHSAIILPACWILAGLRKRRLSAAALRRTARLRARASARVTGTTTDAWARGC